MMMMMMMMMMLMMMMKLQFSSGDVFRKIEKYFVFNFLPHHE